jgi:thioredoxin
LHAIGNTVIYLRVGAPISAQRSTLSQDEELERINRKKLEELIQRKGQLDARATPASSTGPMVLTDSTFSEEVSRHPLMVVDFWAPWCGPCRMVGPVIEQLSGEYAGRVAFGKLNVDENPQVAGAFGIQSIPTILVFKDGQPVDGLLGAVPKSYIERKLEPYLENKNPRSIYG